MFETKSIERAAYLAREQAAIERERVNEARAREFLADLAERERVDRD